MKYVSIRVVDAKSREEAVNEVCDGVFDDGNLVSDAVVELTPLLYGVLLDLVDPHRAVRRCPQCGDPAGVIAIGHGFASVECLKHETTVDLKRAV